MRTFPPVLQPHLLPHSWDVRKVWALQAPATSVPISELTYLLELPMWSSRAGAGMLFDVVPYDVIRDPDVSRYQHERILKANTEYPLDMLWWQNQRWILDGLHRLAKRVMMGHSDVQVRLHSASVLAHIQPDPGTRDV